VVQQILTPVANGLQYAVYWRGLGESDMDTRRRVCKM